MQLYATLRHFTLLYAPLRYFTVFRQTLSAWLGTLRFEVFLKVCTTHVQKIYNQFRFLLTFKDTLKRKKRT